MKKSSRIIDAEVRNNNNDFGRGAGFDMSQINPHAPLLTADSRPLLPHDMLENEDENDEPDLTDLLPPFQRATVNSGISAVDVTEAGGGVSVFAPLPKTITP